MAAQPPTSTADQAQPPVRDTSPVAWARENLFSTWWNGLLTIVFAPLLVWTVWSATAWVATTAQWDIIVVNLTNLMVGIDFPRAQLWRLWVAGAILAVVLGLLVGITAAAARETAIAAGRDPDVPWQENARRLGPPLALLASIIVFVRTPTPVVVLGGVVVVAALAFQVGKRLPHERRKFVNIVVVVGVAAALGVTTGLGGVPIARWGGFLITAYFTVGALLLAFPIGIMVALGRRSSLPMVRWSMSVYVEFFRGAPLIALLFIGWLVLPFMLPPEWENITRISRALIIFVLFTSAYVAEIVRGGLQSIPRGQWEAAKALGLSPWKQTRLIILPQALRNVIPAMVGQAISLYKDTTLVLIIGLSDLLRVAQVITQQSEFLGQGLIIETLVFVSVLYWIPSYWLSRESQRLEARLGVGER